MTHPHMSLYDRAAQFAPFAALTGYEDMIAEEGRLTSSEITLEESQSDIINQKLSVIAEAIEKGTFPTVTITYFVPDSKKAGGEYITITEKIKKIDTAKNIIILVESKDFSRLNLKIPIENITNICGELIDHLDNGSI